MWDKMLKGFVNNPIMFIVFLIGFGVLFTLIAQKVDSADLDKLQEQQKEKFAKLEKKSDTLDEKFDKMAVDIATIVAEWKGFALKETGGKKESFNHVINRWPSNDYLVSWLQAGGEPPTTKGWDSCIVSNFVTVGALRAICRCYYTNPAGLVNITELE